MRKEVKLGTAIGGVLVAVLIVYAIVNKGHSKKNDAVVLETGKPGTGSGNQSAAPDRSGTGGSAATAHSDSPAPSQRDGSGDSQQGAPPTVPGNGAGPSHSDDTTDATPPSHSGTNWGTLLSAENPEITPVHTSTPDPATDGAPGNNLAPPVENRGSGTGGDSPGGGIAPAGSNPSIHNGTGTSDPVVPHASGSQTHKIQSGETFSSISKAFYGDARYFSEIAKANPNVNPNRLKPGTTITLPDKSLFKTEKKEATAGATPAGPGVTPHPTVPAVTTVDAKTEYRVQSTDSLYKISLKLYGTPNKVDAIYQLNKQLIGADPAKLKLNMVLKLPEAPTSATASR